MKQICFNSNNLKNSSLSHDDEYFNIDNQLQYLLRYEKNELGDISLNKTIKREISKKMSSYKSQDKKNGKYDISFITISLPYSSTGLQGVRGGCKV